jgi:hypothetical protein
MNSRRLQGVSPGISGKGEWAEKQAGSASAFDYRGSGKQVHVIDHWRSFFPDFHVDVDPAIECLIEFGPSFLAGIAYGPEAFEFRNTGEVSAVFHLFKVRFLEGSI